MEFNKWRLYQNSFRPQRLINCIKIHFGDILFSSSDDKTIKIWDLITGECTNTIEGHEDSVRSLIFI
jgi:WD40 repeat protein